MAISEPTKKKVGYFFRIAALCLVSVIGLALLGYIIYFMFIWSPTLTVTEKPPTSVQQAAFVNERLKNAIQMLSGLFFVVTAIFTYRTVKAAESNAAAANQNAEAAFKNAKLAQDKQTQESFVKATENLDSEKLSTRIGAIYSLGAIASDSSAYRELVFDVLSAFLRETKKNVKIASSTNHMADAIDEPSLFLSEDLQAAITAIGQRPTTKDDRLIMLHSCVLPYVIFTRSSNRDFSGINFARSYLLGSYGVGCNFEDSYFYKSDLTNVLFDASNCTNVSFDGAVLVGTSFDGTNLIGADLRGVDLSKARNLTQQQINSARVSKTTKLPSGIEHPETLEEDD